MECDFQGWATKNDLKCQDGRIIRKGAFKINDGMTVPLFWNHRHDRVSNVLGHAVLENRDDGVYAYCKLNNSQSGKDAKEAISHGDVVSLSIWANNLKQDGPDVIHGVIREVSLVPAGANPGAFIESVLSHGMPIDDDEEEGIIYTGEPLYLSHSEEQQKNEEPDKKKESKKNVGEIFETLTKEQKEAVAIIVGQAIEDARTGDDEDDDEDDEKGEEMKHNIFDGDEKEKDDVKVLVHSDLIGIIDKAKKMGSLRDAISQFEEETGGSLMHSIDTTGMTVATGTQKYGFNDPDKLFPEFRYVNGNSPEWISRNMDWVMKVMAAVHRTPFSRIKSTYANITEDDARARGYIKGKQKKEEVFTTLKRTTSPQTVYKLQKMDRDDIIDITDFDVISWIRAEMRVMLNEEIARAILIGDGRSSDSDYKIQEAHVRPIVNDVPLFNIKVKVSAESSTDKAEIAKRIIDEVIRSRKAYKGSGNPTFFTTEDILTEMLLLEDKIGHKLYKTESELATALRVKEIVTVEPMDNTKVDGLLLIGVIVNLADYNVGADKGGEITNFDDFDIDFNRYSYLIETRISGALIKPFSAITILLDQNSVSGTSVG